MKHKLFIICTIILSAVFLASCTSSKNTGISKVTVAAPSATTRPTRTPLPVDTATPAPTATATASPTNTLTPTTTPEMDYRQIKLYTQGFLPNFNYFFVFKFPKEIKGKYYLIADSNKDYTCEVYPKNPDRLYCWGRLVRVLDYAPVDLYVQDVAEPIFSDKIFIPNFGQ